MSSHFDYLAIEVEQQPGAAPFFLLTTSAARLLEWADVPRKKADYMAGYQRELDERHKKIREFFQQDKKNVIPGAVIVAAKETMVKVLADDEGGKPLPQGIKRLRIQVEDVEFPGLLKGVYESFLCRLSEKERDSITAEKPVENGEPVDPKEDLDEDEEGPPPASYLSQLTRELQQAVATGIDSLPAHRASAVRDYVLGVTKPGLILDGQHRVFGAKEVVDFDVVLPVVLMPGLALSEQVFHFYVLNNKAKPLRPTELRATISTSLSNAEIDDLYDRFLRSGVKAEEARWTHLINSQQESPFFGLIDFGFKQGSGFIPENVAFQIASFFLKPSKPYRALVKTVDQWANNDDYKMKLFFVFWNGIKKKYPNAWQDGIAKLEGQIFFKATMLVLEKLLFDDMARDVPKLAAKGMKSPFADPDDLAATVDAALHFLPEEFFTREWTETGLDTPERRNFLQEQMEDAIKKQGKNLGYLTLFKAKAKTS